MSTPDLNNLTAYLNNRELLLQTVRQLQKDFSEFSITISFNGTEPDPYDYLVGQLTLVLEKLLETRREVLMNLLYRIDLSEEQVSKCVSTSMNETATALARLILERELKKVLLRNYFKNK